jgi:hypothetical protein
MLHKLFTEHAHSVGETYFEHVHTALGFAWTMAFGAFACLIHAFLPFLFVKTGSKVIIGMHDQMVTNRSRIKPTVTQEKDEPGIFLGANI